jgi:hypothetical protein
MAATGQIAGIAADGGDPRLHHTQGPGPIPPSNRLLHDPNVSFYEYMHYAKLTREEEEETFRTNPPTQGIMQVLFPTKSSGGVTPIAIGSGNGYSEKEVVPGENGTSEKEVGVPRQRIEISEAEWTNASRAVRTASGSACFYLITTDILGPFGIG